MKQCTLGKGLRRLSGSVRVIVVEAEWFFLFVCLFFLFFVFIVLFLFIGLIDKTSTNLGGANCE